MTDPIADMLTRIRNAQMVKKSEVVIPFSKLKFGILKVFESEGWIKSVEEVEPTVVRKSSKINTKKRDQIFKFATLKVVLKYDKDNNPHIKSLKRVSKPGRRVYAGKDNIPYVLNGKGMVVVSTPKGLMTGRKARKDSVGGEIICEVY